MFHQVSWLVWCFFAFFLIVLTLWSLRSTEYIFKHIPDDAEVVTLTQLRQKGSAFSLFQSLDLNHGQFLRYRNIYIFKTRFTIYGFPRGLYAFLVTKEVETQPKMTSVYPAQQEEAKTFYNAKIYKFTRAELDHLYKTVGINRYSPIEGVFAEQNKSGLLIIVAGKIRNPNLLNDLQRDFS